MSNIFYTKLYPYIKEAMDSKNNRNKLMSYIYQYFDNNNEVLSANAPYKQLYFKETDKNYPFLFIKYDMREIPAILSEIKKVGSLSKHPWKILGEPRFWVYVLLIKYFQENSKTEEELNAMIMYMACYFYSSLYYGSFRFEPNENIMNYTINNLSNRFYIKKYKTIYNSLLHTVKSSHLNFQESLKKCSDEDMIKYIISFRTSIASFLQNIAAEFYKNYKEKNYINMEKDVHDDETFIEVDNVSFQIDRKAAATNNYMISSKYDENIVSLVSTLTTVSENVVKSAIIDIIEKKGYTLKEIIALIIDIYVLEGNKIDTIPTKKFISTCLLVYTSSNVKNKSILKLKEMLDELLKESSSKYLLTNRAATRSNFRKAVFLYFVFAIQKTYHFKG